MQISVLEKLPTETQTMIDVLKEIRYLENKEYFTDRDGRWQEYQYYLEEFYDDWFTDKSARVIKYFRTGSIEFSDKPAVTVIPFGLNPVVECYDHREKGVWEAIQSNLIAIKSEKIPSFIRVTAKEVKRIAKAVEMLALPEELSVAQIAIVAKLQNLGDRVLGIHTDIEIVVSDTPNDKLKWLGSTKLLTTLLYELWKGQVKSKTLKTDPLIECDTKEQMMRFIRRNFVNKDGEEISPETVKDYLDVSKATTRVSEGYRIEIPLKRSKK